MKLILKQKKGANDVTHIAIIVIPLILVGLFLPYINEGFGEDGDDINVDGFEDQLNDAVKDEDSISAFTVVFSLVTIFFWTFGALPFWLDAIFLIFRVILALLIYRQVRHGGGLMKKLILALMIMIILSATASADVFFNVSNFNVSDWDNTGTYGVIHTGNAGAITEIKYDRLYHEFGSVMSIFNVVNISNGTSPTYFNGSTFCVEMDIHTDSQGAADVGVGFGAQHPSSDYNYALENMFGLQGTKFNVYQSQGGAPIVKAQSSSYGVAPADTNPIGIKYCRLANNTYNISFWNLSTPTEIHPVNLTINRDINNTALIYVFVHSYEEGYNISRILIYNETPDSEPPFVFELEYDSATEQEVTISLKNSFFVNVTGNANLTACTLSVNSSYYPLTQLTNDTFYITKEGMTNENHTFYVNCSSAADEFANTTTSWVDIKYYPPHLSILAPEDNYTTNALWVWINVSVEDEDMMNLTIYGKNETAENYSVLHTELTATAEIQYNWSLRQNGNYTFYAIADDTIFTNISELRTIVLDIEFPDIYLVTPNDENTTTHTVNTTFYWSILTIDDNSIWNFNLTCTNYSAYRENISIAIYPYSNTTVFSDLGNQTCHLKVCDSHTKKEINGTASKDVGQKKFSYEGIDLISEEELDDITFEKKKDRYTFCFDTKTKKKNLTITLPEQCVPIQSTYNGHYVCDMGEGKRYWVDFEGYNLIEHKKGKVVIDNPDEDKTLCFDSVGELNCNAIDFYFEIVEAAEEPDPSVPLQAAGEIIFSIVALTLIIMFAIVQFRRGR